MEAGGDEKHLIFLLGLSDLKQWSTVSTLIHLAGSSVSARFINIVNIPRTKLMKYQDWH